MRGALDDPEVGRVAVITPRSERDWAAKALATSLPHGTVGSGVGALDAVVSVLSPSNGRLPR